MLGKITSIEEVNDLKIEAQSDKYDKLIDYSNMDGYKIKTETHTFHMLIDNFQSCCESWGYFSSEDDLTKFIGSDLIEIKLTDKALDQSTVEDTGYYEDGGGIQFVDFVTSQGTFQLAVYNAHNGYYGHGILLTKDNDTLVDDYL